MEGTPSENRGNSTFTFDPTNMVVGVIDNADATKDALRDLVVAGLSKKKTPDGRRSGAADQCERRVE
jgi:hypothetical protein